MEKDDQDRIKQASAARGTGSTPPYATSLKLAALAVTLVSVATATGFLAAPFLRPQEARPAAEAAPGTQADEGTPLFRGWPKPDVALVLTGEQHGYLQPCGCTEPQKGGLARRYNFLQTLNKRGWPVVAADLGDIAQEASPQALLKFKYSMKALEHIGYTAVSIGKNEVDLDLLTALAEAVLNEAKAPRPLVANLLNKDAAADLVKSWVITAAANDGPKVGIVGITGPELAKKLQKNGQWQFGDENKVLAGAIQGMQAKNADLLLLLYQGTIDEAKAIAAKNPQINVILCLSRESEPSSRADQVGQTTIVSVGHKGRYLGVVGAYRTGKADQPFELRYELVELDPRYETPEGKDNTNPIHGLMQEYAEKVRDGNYLAKYMLNSLHPLQVTFPNAEYLGSEACKVCHKDAYNIWKSHPHSHAYGTLKVRAKRPTLRQFDGECVKCHVTGFAYKTGFRSEEQSPKLLNVGCEECHGPGSLHVRDKNNVQFREALNPWKSKEGETTKKHEDRMFSLCFRCHDTDNSVHFDFPEYWYKKKTEHKNKDE